MKNEKIKIKNFLIIFVFALVGLVFARAVYAYTGTHNFLNLAASTSDGHSYQSEYLASGSFPFNGLGVYDGSQVRLTGILNVLSIDEVPVSQSYCVKLRGNLSVTGKGELSATKYTDKNCRVVSGVENFEVSSYSEDASGNFSLIATNSSGISWTANGSHSFSKKK